MLTVEALRRRERLNLPAQVATTSAHRGQVAAGLLQMALENTRQRRVEPLVGIIFGNGGSNFCRISKYIRPGIGQV